MEKKKKWALWFAIGTLVFTFLSLGFNVVKMEIIGIKEQVNGFDVMDGNDIEMPTYFDDMTERAALGYAGHTEEGRKNGTYLKNVMERVGFKAYDGEWWHFYDVTTEPTPFLDFQI